MFRFCFPAANASNLLFMDARLKQLERWRQRTGITKTELAKLLGTKQAQTYTNWVMRGSIPKDYTEKVDAVLASNSVADAQVALATTRISQAAGAFADGPRALDDAQARDFARDLAQLNEEELMAFLHIVRARLSPSAKLQAARLMLGDVQEFLSPPGPS